MAFKVIICLHFKTLLDFTGKFLIFFLSYLYVGCSLDEYNQVLNVPSYNVHWKIQNGFLPSDLTHMLLHSHSEYWLEKGCMWIYKIMMCTQNNFSSLMLSALFQFPK